MFCAAVAANEGGLFDDLKSKATQTIYYTDRLTAHTATDRLVAWRAALPLITENLVCGVGTGTAINLLGRNESPYTTHNFYLDLLLLQGIPATAAYVGIVTYILMASLKASKQRGSRALARTGTAHFVLTSGMLCFYVANMEKVQIASLFWLGAGIIAVARRRLGGAAHVLPNGKRSDGVLQLPGLRRPSN